MSRVYHKPPDREPQPDVLTLWIHSLIHRRSFQIYVFSLLATFVFVYFQLLAFLGINWWAHWSLVAVIFSGVYANYLISKVYTGKEEEWRNIWAALKNNRGFAPILFLLQSVSILMLLGSIITLFALPDKIVDLLVSLLDAFLEKLGWYMTSGWNPLVLRDSLHAIFVFGLVFIVFCVELHIVRGVGRYEKSIVRLRRTLLLVNLPAVVGFAILSLYSIMFMLQAPGDRTIESFEAGAEAFQLFAFNLLYLIVSSEPMEV